ncbi:MAG: hypothetical protein QXL85_02130 [Candidatus Bathyarchaeia archaeon]
MDRQVREKTLKSLEERVRSSLRGYKAATGVPTWPAELFPKPIAYYPSSREAQDDFFERTKRGEYKLPLYADLPGMPEHERRVIFGLMVAQEGKTWILYRNLTQAGFDPDKDMLQSYWFGASPPLRSALDPLEHIYFQGGGGIVYNWDFKTSLEGLYVAGDACIYSSEHSGAAVTGRWAGAKAADYARGTSFGEVIWDQVEREKQRVYAPTKRTKGINWKELNVAICKVMRTYVNDLTNEEMLKIALKWLEELEQGEAQKLVARNPHELARSLETLGVLTNAKLIVLYTLEKMRRGRVEGMLTMRLKEDGGTEFRDLPPRWWLLLPYAPTYRENYEKHKPW